MKSVTKVAIIDGYSDEPAGLGVPPYIDVYPRYVYGAIKYFDKSIDVKYFTVDEVRRDKKVLEYLNRCDLVVFIASVVVPGRYLCAEPIKYEELTLWPKMLTRPVKVLGGAVARFGFGVEGGRPAIPPERFKQFFDLVVSGDLEIVVYRLLEAGLSIDRVDPSEVREGYGLVDEFAVRGAEVVRQHPNYGKNLIAEVETYRGCPRYVVGGCSFCIEPRRGGVVFRSVEGVLREVKALYDAGVRHVRIGRQPDLYSYMAKDTGKVEFPKPNVEAIEKLFSGIRNVAPDLETLHIDNVNPGTIYHHPEECREITRIIIKYHTPGDVAAFGIESADPKVVKMNNLKVMPDEAFEAVKLLNEWGGARRGWNGLPELLPGINFVLGLPGERKETYYLNFQFLKRILDSGLMIRRVNIRQLLALKGTPVWEVGDSIARKHKRYIEWFRRKVREEIDLPMLRRVVPKGTVLKRVYVEVEVEGKVYGRQPGTYPLIVEFLDRPKPGKYVDVVVLDHGYRSVSGAVVPINVNTASVKVLSMLPGSNRVKAFKIVSLRPIKDPGVLVKLGLVSKDALKVLST